jgi:hypothetical protein
VIVAFAMLVLAAIAAGAVGLVFYWKSQHASDEVAPSTPPRTQRDAGRTR